MPNTFEYGDFETAWAPLNPNGTIEFIRLGFDPPAAANGVTIRETNGNGFVVGLDLIDTGDVVHSVSLPGDPSVPGAPAEFVITFPATAFLVKAVEVRVDTDHDLATWEEIDAVRLHPVCERTTGVDPAPINSLSLSLGPMCPQPTRDRVTAELALPRASDVRFEVFDLSGRSVSSFNRMLQAGRQTLEWDGRTGEGKRVTPGVYFARITAAGVEMRRRIIVVR